ncbi:hypothetical protein CR513_54671, partial [Mucuna pruriens]
MAICEGVLIFLKAINISKEYKNKHYMVNVIKNVIKELNSIMYFGPLFVVYILNLRVKILWVVKNIGKNKNVFDECGWMIKIFSTLKLLFVAETCFSSIIVMLKRLKLLKRLQNMIISDQLNSYRKDDVRKATQLKEIILNDMWWDKIDYILSFMNPIT